MLLSQLAAGCTNRGTVMEAGDAVENVFIFLKLNVATRTYSQL